MANLDKNADLDKIDKLVRSLLLTFKEGLSINKLDQAYDDICGEKIPHRRYGFANLGSLLKVLPSISMSGSWVKAIPSEKDIHMHQLVAEQKTAKSTSRKKFSYRPGNGYDNGRHHFSRGYNLQNNYNPPQYNWNTVYKQNGFDWNNSYTQNSSDWHNSYRQNSMDWNNSYRQNSMDWSNPYRQNSSNWNNSNKQTESNWNNSCQRNESNWNDSCHQNESHWNTIPKKNSYSGTSSNMKNVHYNELHNKAKESVEQKENNIKDLDKLTIPISESTIERLKILLKKNANGISSEKMVNCYEEMFPDYKDDFDWESMNHKSLEGLLNTAPNGLFRKAYSLSERELYFPFPSSFYLDVPINMSEELVTANDKFTPADIQKLRSMEVLVYVAEIYSPNRFYLNLADNNSLDELMDHIEQFYTTDKKSWLKINKLRNSTPVIVLYDDNRYYRAIVNDVSHSDAIEVFIVDYGTTYYVDEKNIYAMKRKFLEVPIQGIEASLSNVRPFKSDGWDEKAAQWLQIHFTPKFNAVLVDEINDSVDVILTPVNSVKSINDDIVQCNIGKYCIDPVETKEKLIPAMNTLSLNNSDMGIEKSIAAVNTLSLNRSKAAREKIIATKNIFSTNGNIKEKLRSEAPQVAQLQGTFTMEEMDQFKTVWSVKQMENEAIEQFDICIGELMKQRDSCLLELSKNPDREDIFDYVHVLYSVIRKVKTLKEFNTDYTSGSEQSSRT